MTTSHTDPDLAAKFFENGYYVIENFLTQEECDELCRECNGIVDRLDPALEHRTVFTTTDDNKIHKDDAYFLTSGDKIRYFFEKDAFDSSGELQVPKERCLNKIGHALHALSPSFRKVTFSEKIQRVAKQLGCVDPVVTQSMVIFKPPGIGGEVSPHQDATFLYSEPNKLYGFWIALEDATVENGCLWFIPKSHNNGLDNGRRFVRDHSDDGSVLMKVTAPLPDYDQSLFVPGAVKRGGLVLIHGYNVHKSEHNNSDKCRTIYTFHIVDTHESVYSSKNWLQPTETLPFPHLYSYGAAASGSA